MNFLQSIEKTKQNFISWWERKDFGRPLTKMQGVRSEINWPFVPSDFRKQWMDPDFRFALTKAVAESRNYYFDALPFIDLNMGPGSMAAYLGAEPVFKADTVWYEEIAKNSLRDLGTLKYDQNNDWWKEHKRCVSELTTFCKNTPLFSTIPDILENMDILSLLRSPQELCYDMMDCPLDVHKYLDQVEELFYIYYEDMYNIVKAEDGSCAFTAFSIWGPGKTAKIQCDFSTLMSPDQYKEFVLPSLKRQTEKIDYTLYHLDGVDAIRHLDSILSMDKLNALQWTPGAGQIDGGDESWYFIYDKVIEHGKGLWISMDQGGVERWIEKSRSIVKRYGTAGIYFLYADLIDQDAQKLASEVEKGFK